MIQSMSRVAHCTDNGPMEGFWGILKREMYYGKQFHTRDELVQAITEYMITIRINGDVYKRQRYKSTYCR